MVESTVNLIRANKMSAIESDEEEEKKQVEGQSTGKILLGHTKAGKSTLLNSIYLFVKQNHFLEYRLPED